MVERDLISMLRQHLAQPTADTMVIDEDPDAEGLVEVQVTRAKGAKPEVWTAEQANSYVDAQVEVTIAEDTYRGFVAGILFCPSARQWVLRVIHKDAKIVCKECPNSDTPDKQYYHIKGYSLWTRERMEQGDVKVLRVVTTQEPSELSATDPELLAQSYGTHMSTVLEGAE